MVRAGPSPTIGDGLARLRGGAYFLAPSSAVAASPEPWFLVAWAAAAPLALRLVRASAFCSALAGLEALARSSAVAASPEPFCLAAWAAASPAGLAWAGMSASWVRARPRDRTSFFMTFSSFEIEPRCCHLKGAGHQRCAEACDDRYRLR